MIKLYHIKIKNFTVSFFSDSCDRVLSSDQYFYTEHWSKNAIRHRFNLPAFHSHNIASNNDTFEWWENGKYIFKSYHKNIKLK